MSKSTISLLCKFPHAQYAIGNKSLDIAQGVNPLTKMFAMGHEGVRQTAGILSGSNRQ
jgi:hypothetical protein